MHLVNIYGQCLDEVYVSKHPKNHTPEKKKLCMHLMQNLDFSRRWAIL